MAPERGVAAQPSGEVRAADEAVGSLERFEPATLAGEPLIDLSDEDASVDGSVTLRLSIDETGHVVNATTSVRKGLTDGAVALFLRSFASYEYVPARRGGRSVKSDVTLVVGVWDGKSGAVPGR